MQPAGGPGDKIFPPTYPAAERERRGAPGGTVRHVFECRRIGDRDVWCVLLDSVSSQANRMEQALLDAAESGQLTLPRLVVDFGSAGLGSLGRVTSLDAPHRVFDAILRDSLLDGEVFNRSHLGSALLAASLRDATAVLEASPSALLFGAWNSTGEDGGLGARFPRAMVSEIIGVGVPVDLPGPASGSTAGGPAGSATGEPRTLARRTLSRIDPLGISSRADVYRGEAGWDTTPDGAGPAAERVRPSQINHGNVTPTVQELGVTCDYAEQTAVITLAGLRRLRFGGDAARDRAARAVIAALGLLALTELDASGYALRSRCDLVCDGAAPMELVGPDGTIERFELDREAALATYAECVAAARAAGFLLEAEPKVLLPQDKLVRLVQAGLSRTSAGSEDRQALDAGL